MLGIWNEKYRPGKLGDVLGNSYVLKKFSEYIETKNIPHLLFYGPAGTGKSTTAKILAREISEDFLYVNASDETSIDTMRNKIKQFCMTASMSPFKIVILDEADFLSLSSMSMLRNVLEAFHENSRFILTANYLQKIIDPIRSRCQVFEFVGSSKNDIMKRLCEILLKEKVKFELSQVVEVVKRTYPDIRKAINLSQQLTVETDGVRTLRGAEVLDVETTSILDLIKKGDISGLRLELSRKSYVLEQLYSYIFDNAEKISVEKSLDVMLMVGEAMYRHSVVIDPQINFVSMCIEISRLLKE